MTIVVPTLESPAAVQAPRPRSRRQGPDLAAILIPLIACLYVGVVILLPALSVVASAFAKGLGPFLENFQSHELLSALRLTLFATAVAVPCNVIFGLAAATVVKRHPELVLRRHEIWPTLWGLNPGLLTP
ncbi:hypothetical protein VB734_14070 [Synechococcus sp. BA-124 BA4]|uniref:hypothetical protein n=1 Tax=Synechococcus sp. BA-124 BA4 TaxID=3110251 RepID=UPI002B22185E|nr:hypothetical protein [Synechococcus sp. BA-124 BA4]MEA5401164.1 hypothetical protein [Synechococcus sp. BA-124 BA4]